MVGERSFERGAARVGVTKCRVNDGDIVSDGEPLGTEPFEAIDFRERVAAPPYVRVNQTRVARAEAVRDAQRQLRQRRCGQTTPSDAATGTASTPMAS